MYIYRFYSPGIRIVIVAPRMVHVVSVEEEKQKASTLEQSSTQTGLQLDTTVTMRTKKRVISSKPDT